MDIDLAKVVLIALAVLPGYLARRGSDRVIPRTRRTTGATEEIAEFLIFSVAAHLILALLYGIFWMIAGHCWKQSAWFFVGTWLQLAPSDLLKKLGEIPATSLAIYLFLSLITGWFLGIGLGLFGALRGIERIARKLGIENSWAGQLWSKHINIFLITSRPMIYDVLIPELDEDGNQKTVYAEILLKNNQESVTGRVKSFSTANDEESHKLIYLEDVYRKNAVSGSYEKIEADGILFDLADAVTLQVKQV